ncbi:MAG: DUF1697 domain-containing protein [Verrucomicrobiales bacterium]
MQTWVALLRGINVGGRNILPMAKLRSLLESQNCRDVRTYIQSGNVVFRSAAKSRSKLSESLLDAIESEFVFRPGLMLLTAGEFLGAKACSPFSKAVAEPKTLHFFFLESEAKTPDIQSIAELAAPTETFQLTGRVFYLHAPDGIGRSKLAANVERKLGVAATARNYATVEKISEMLS